MASTGSSTRCPTSHLVCLFLTTAGQNEDGLGSDEEQIVEVVYLLYDVTNNKVVTLQQTYVRPLATDETGEVKLTNECKSVTGLDEDMIKNSQSLEHVLDDLDRFLRSKEIHPEHGGKPFCFCTDGPLHLRQCLHPEAFRKKLVLPSHFYRYFDLRKCVQERYGEEHPTCSSLKEMLNSGLGLDADQSIDYGTRQCQNMAAIIRRLVSDGHQFMDPETIMEKLEPGICYSDGNIDDDTVVKARGLPWQSSDQDIANFFRGLNIARGGVALCLSQQGRRNGEALIRLETSEQRSLALRRHKHHIGQRYIEVYRATGKDFVNIAGGSSREAQMFLSRHSADGMQVIVRMRGLPYSCTADQVIKFFQQGPTPVDVLDEEDGILFVHQADGRATGDAFVLFASDEVAQKALQKHRQCIGPRYIELFKSTTAEVLQVLNRSLDPRTPSNNDCRAIFPEMTILALPALPTMPSAGLVATTSGTTQQQHITSGKLRNCVRLRNLPVEATVTDIVSFLAEHARDVTSQGVHLIYSAEGTPSGEAFIQMESEQAAELTALSKHKKLMFVANKQRYVDVIQCSGDEMSMLLQHGLPAPAPPPATGPALVFPQGPVIQLQQPSTVQTLHSVQPQAAATYWTVQPHATITALQQPCRTALPPLHATAPGLAAAEAAVLQQFVSAPMTNGFNQSTLIALPPSQANTLSGGPQMSSNLLAGATVHPATAAAMIHPSACHPPQGIPQVATQLLALPPQNHTAALPLGHLAVNPQTLPVNIPAGFGPSAGAVPPGFQPIFYWYPSPPVSPQNGAYILPGSAATIAVKGLPCTVKVNDLLAFFEGIYEMQPDVQLHRGIDGKPTGEAFVTFGSRAEADRAIAERNRKLLGNKLVDLRMVV